MFRSSSGSLEGNTSPIDNMSSFHSLNMFLDTHNLSPPVSSATLSPPTTPLTPEPATQFPLLTDNQSNMNAAAAATAASNAASTLLLQRQYQYHLLLQQQQQQLALAQHQLALAASAAAANHQQKDEIAHSLKMFALLTACGNADNASGSTQDAMQEFASNGYVSDDINRLQYNHNNNSSSSSNSTSSPPSPQLPRCPQFPGMSGGAPGTVPPAAAAASLAAAHWINLNQYREQLNYVWRSMSALPYIPNVVNNTAGLGHLSSGGGGGSQKNLNTLGLAMQPEQQQLRSPSTANIINTNSNNTNNNTNKLSKRYVNGKSGKEMVPRHCVFCENNNEPEALVNSHSVRDSYGRVLCPKLRTYVCPICGASGDSAHTIKYCPKKPIVTMEDAIKAESFRLAKSNYYKQQMKV